MMLFYVSLPLLIISRNLGVDKYNSENKSVVYGDGDDNK